MSKSPKLLTPEEAGHMLGISESRVRQYLRAGTLAGYRLPRGVEWRIAAKEVQRFSKVKPKRGRPKKVSAGG